MHSFLKIILLCAQSIPTVLSIKIPSWITNPQVQGPVKNAKLRSCKIPKLFEIINWSFLLNGIVCDCVLFFRFYIIERQSCTTWKTTETKQKLWVASVIPFYGTILWISFYVRLMVDLWWGSSSKPQMSQSFCLWAGHLMTTLPLVNHEYK